MKSLDIKIKELSYIDGLYEFVLENCFIAGGAVRDTLRGKEPKDYDLFFRTEVAKEVFIARFSKHFSETGLGNFNYGKFQFITLYTGTPQEVVSTFDWNVNMVFYEFGSRGVYQHTINTLHFNVNARKPLSALLRLPYLIEKGFKIEGKELMFLVSFISQVTNLKAGSDLSEQFEFMSSGGTYVDSASAERAVSRASEEAVKHSPLYKAMK